MPILRTLLAIWFVSAIAFHASAADPDPIWPRLAPCFSPPAQYANQFGPYRSPLKFDDGSDVKTPADWPRRRAEILRKWTDLMGPWPPLLDHPKLDILKTVDRGDHVQHSITVQVAPTQSLAGYLLIPKDKGPGPFPAVLVPFYDPDTSIGNPPKNRGKLGDYARQLARRGFVTLAIGSPGGDARKPDTAGATCQPLSYLAYVAANCATALSQRPDVDPQRIGVVGHSYGGKWAMFASCLCDKFAAAAWSDPGIVFDEPRSNVNYWEPWYLGLDPTLPAQRKPGLITPDNPRTGAYKIMVERGMDLHELHALMAPRPFLVSGGSEDTPARWVALNHAVAVNRLLGYENRVAMHNRPAHPQTPEANEIVYLFFEHFLARQTR
jgi:dienelactone hydrolase